MVIIQDGRKYSEKAVKIEKKTISESLFNLPSNLVFLYKVPGTDNYFPKEKSKKKKRKKRRSKTIDESTELKE